MQFVELKSQNVKSPPLVVSARLFTKRRRLFTHKALHDACVPPPYIRARASRIVYASQRGFGIKGAIPQVRMLI